MRRALLLLAAALAATPAAAAERLAYKASMRAETLVTPRWAHDGANLTPDEINALVAEARGIELRFDAGRYAGREVRIHMVLPPALKGLRGSSGLRVEWRTQGRFLPGSIVPGSRVLVYQGPVAGRELRETFDFTLHLDARAFQGGLGFDPAFEIEDASQ